MGLGLITGKTSTNRFQFLVQDLQQVKKFHYVKVVHREGYGVLGYVTDLERQGEETTASCLVLGYRDPQQVLRTIRIPLEPGSAVLEADDAFIRETLGLGETKGAYFGVLEGRDKLPVYLDLNKLLTRHAAILAKTGSGKSYAVGVLLEEIMEKNVPILVIDPHGEYSTLKFPNDRPEAFARFGITPKGYLYQMQEYSPDVQRNPEARPLKLGLKNLSGAELMHLLPGKLSSTQVGLLYSALMDSGDGASFDQLLINLQLEDHPAKWTLITVIEYLKKLNLFSDTPTPLAELIQPGKCSLLNLRGVPQELQEIIVYKLVQDLFTARKNTELPPFFLVVEEAHNFVPERTYGEAKSSLVLRQIASEGRKFGVGLAVVSQRPARLEKNVLSQCHTQIILKVTNPHDVKAIGNSVEGMTSEVEDELRNLHIGTALVVGVVDLPLLVEVRPRRSKHGGEAVNILEVFTGVPHAPSVEAPQMIQVGDKKEVVVPVVQTAKTEVLNILKPKLSVEDVKVLCGNKLKRLETHLVPCGMITCKQKHLTYQILCNLTNGQIVTDLERGTGIAFPLQLDKLSDKEQKLFNLAFQQGKDFTAADLFAKSGMQFSEVYETIQFLLKKQYLASQGGKFGLSQLLQIFPKLQDYACYEKNDFVSLPYDKKLSAKYSLSDFAAVLTKFVSLEGQKECYLVKYDVEYTK